MCTRSTGSPLRGVPVPSSSLESSEAEDDGMRAGAEPLHSLSGRSLLAQQLLGLRGCARRLSPSVRRKRQMTPEDKKDATYWDKRQKNNEAAKRSRERRRFNDFVLEGQLLALSEENAKLRAEMLQLQCHFGLATEQPADSPAPSHHPAPSRLKSSLWSLRARAGAFPRDKEGDGEFFQDPRVSWTALIGGNNVSSNQSPFPGSIPGTGIPAHYLGPLHSLQRSHFLPQHQPENQGLTLGGRLEKAPQQTCSSRAGPAEPEGADSHQGCSSKETSLVEFKSRTCSKLSFLSPSHACPSLPSLPPSAQLAQSRFPPGPINPSICGSLLLPWGASGLHLTPIYYNQPLYLPLDSSKVLPQVLDMHRNLKSQTDAFSAELAHLRRHFVSENC
ncbi:hypothetical protein Z043_120439 [Scleropages formosus]|uniref:BZIP domain-containing protein n=1 Tax=Scleropages formosus TaxID=113540 RepID=A0A0P7U3F4_SCLFO|nr:hypothetical protein Z043_120439 [Scleropages formosus]